MNDNTGLISKQVQFYKELGIKTVPLKPRTKEVFISGWYEKSHEELWSQGFNFNVGIQLDGDLICVDADNKKTADLFDSILSVYDPPVVKTRGGKHYYFRVKNAIWDKSYRKMIGEYSGEIRLQNCYVVAPPSFVLSDNYKNQSLGHHTYELISGNFNNIPTVNQEIVEMWSTNYCRVTTTKFNETRVVSVDEPPLEQLDNFNKITIPLFRRNWRSMKYLAQKIHELNDNDDPKLKYGRVTYTSRSEVLQSVVVTLKLCGYSDNDIVNIAIEENLVIEPKNVNYHIGLSCSKADAYFMTKEVIKTLHRLYFMNLSFKHPNDKLVYRALLSIGVQFTTLTPYLTKTQLRKITGILNYTSLGNSLTRLNKAGYIEKLSGDKYGIIGEGVGGKESVSLSSDWFTNNSLSVVLNIEKLLGKSYDILKYLNDGEKKSSDVYKNMTVSKRSVINQLNKLLKMELITRTKVGKNVTYKLVENLIDILYEMSVKTIQRNTDKINQDNERLNGWRAESALYYGLVKLNYSKEDILEFIAEGRKQPNWFDSILLNNTTEDMIALFNEWLAR